MKTYDINGETFIRITDLQPYIATDLPIKVESNYGEKIHTIIPSTFLSLVKINGNYYVDMDYYKQKYRVDDIFVKSEGLSAPPFINKYRYKYNTVYKVNSKNQPLFEIVDNKSNVIKSIPSINSSNRYNLIQYKDFINNIKFINNFIYENEIIKKETK